MAKRNRRKQRSRRKRQTKDELPRISQSAQRWQDAIAANNPTAVAKAKQRTAALQRTTMR